MVWVGPYWFTPNNWEEIAYDIFKWIKRIMIATQFYLIFARPALNKPHRTQVAWFGQSIMSLQVFFWIPYLSGSFGGVVDQFHSGIARARMDFFGLKTSSAYLSSNFVSAS